MKRIIGCILMMAFVFSSISSSAQFNKKRKSKKDTHNFRYEIACIGEGKQGTYAIKVFSYSKKPRIAIEAAKIAKENGSSERQAR